MLKLGTNLGLNCKLQLRCLEKITLKIKYEEIHRFWLTIEAVRVSADIPVCISIEDIEEATLQNKHLQDLSTYIVVKWPCTKA